MQVFECVGSCSPRASRLILAFASLLMQVYKRVGSHWRRASWLMLDLCILVDSCLQACWFMLTKSISVDVWPLHLSWWKSSNMLVHASREHLVWCLLFASWLMQIFECVDSHWPRSYRFMLAFCILVDVWCLHLR